MQLGNGKSISLRVSKAAFLIFLTMGTQAKADYESELIRWHCNVVKAHTWGATMLYFQGYTKIKIKELLIKDLMSDESINMQFVGVISAEDDRFLTVLDEHYKNKPKYEGEALKAFADDMAEFNYQGCIEDGGGVVKK